MAIGRTTRWSEAISGGGPWTTTGSFTLTSGHLHTIAVTLQHFGGGGLPTGFTFDKGVWDPITHIDDVPDQHSIWKYRGIGNGDSGVLTITAVGGSLFKMVNISCEDWTGTDVGGTNGSAGIVQSNAVVSASANPQDITIPLSALTDPVNNAVYFAQSAGAASTPDGAYTEIVDQAGTDYFLETGWLLPGDTAPGATSGTAFQPQVGIAIEIKAAGAGAPPSPVVSRSRRFLGWTA